jgi:hypothetical protein
VKNVVFWDITLDLGSRYGPMEGSYYYDGSEYSVS